MLTIEMKTLNFGAKIHKVYEYKKSYSEISQVIFFMIGDFS